MSILIDLSQLAVASAVKTPGVARNEINKDLIKHMILNSIRTYVLKFRDQFGEVVICCDSKNNWRRKVFPHYKAKRKQNRDNSFINWDEIFQALGELKSELREYFPYKVIELEGAEADDIIAVLARDSETPVVIIGSDKDYGQLHLNPNVKQFCPKKKKFITYESPAEQLQELIICGDKSDGIPNIKSDGDVFVTDGKRQPPISKKKLVEWVKLRPEFYCDTREMLQNYERNRSLIDFNYIPFEISEEILNLYRVDPLGDKRKIMDYFMKNRMRNLMACIGDF